MSDEQRTTGLAQYACHKLVNAGQITAINAASLTIDDEDGNAISRIVSDEWLKKHNPEVGGYFVVYADGYESYSPVEAFEKGYTLGDGSASKPSQDATAGIPATVNGGQSSTAVPAAPIATDDAEAATPTAPVAPVAPAGDEDEDAE